MKLSIQSIFAISIWYFFAPITIDAQRYLSHEGFHEYNQEISFDHNDLINRASFGEQVSITVPDIDQKPMDLLLIENEFLTKEFEKSAYKSYSIAQVNGQITNGRCLLTPYGVFYSIYTENGLISFSPSPTNKGQYLFANGNDHHEGHNHTACGNSHEQDLEVLKLAGADLSSKKSTRTENGEILRTYRVAVACTYEFFSFQGAQSEAYALAILDGISLIYNMEMSINLVPAAMPFVYTNPNDPFTPNNFGGDSRTNQASEVVASLFDNSTFDIGHVFHLYSDPEAEGWSSGGVALLRSVCSEQTYASDESPDDGMVGINKAAGWSGNFESNSLNRFIRLACHEFGHQFGATHTFKGSGGSCDGAYTAETAYEIGSGTTIMSYRGICETSQNITPGGEADDYFHSASLLQMIDFIETAIPDCANNQLSGNNIPEIDANPCGINNIVIPRSTPFILTGEAADADGDILRHCWEQFDNGGPQGFISTNAANNFFSPIFRSYPPSSSPSRYFPRLYEVVNNIPNDFDILSNVPRELDFHYTVRDGAAINTDSIDVTIDDDGPLLVTYPTGVEVWDVGGEAKANWDMNGSSMLCDEVDILLSTNGGFSFDYVIATGVNYINQTYFGPLPLSIPPTDKAKIMVKCSDNDCIQFYNVSDGFFTINSSCVATDMVVCDTETVTGDVGDPVFALDPFGIVADISFELDIDITTSDPILNFYGINENDDCGVWITRRTELDTFQVSQDGNYTFSRSQSDEFISIYTLNGLDFDNACPNLIGTNLSYLTSGGYFLSGDLSVNLQRCETYVMTTAGAQQGTNFTMNIFPNDGGSFYTLSNHEPDYATGYIAVNNVTGLIEAANTDADFTTLPPGEYNTHAITYKVSGPEPPSNVDLSTLVGSDLQSLLDAGNCVLASEDFKLLIVNELMACSIDSIVPFPESSCLDTETYNQNFIVYYSDFPSDQSNIIVNGMTFPASGTQTFITLLNLPADGSTMNIDVSVENVPECMNTFSYTNASMSTGIEVSMPGVFNVCEGESIMATSELATSFEWSVLGSSTTYSGNPIIPTESGTYFLTVFDDVGCSDMAAAEVNLTPAPTVSFVEEDPFTICSSPVYELTPNQTGALFYEWQIINFDQSDTTFIESSTINTSVDIEISGTYIVTVGNLACTASDTIEVIVTPSPELILPTTDTTVCGIDFINITGIANTALDLDNISWTDSNGDEVSSGFEASFFSNDTYTLTVIDQNQCSAQETIDVTFEESIEVVIDGGSDTTLCRGSSLLIEAFTDVSINVGWVFDNGLELDTSDILGAYDVTESGKLIAMIESNGCVGRDTICISEVDPPNFLLQTSTDPNQELCEGDAVILTANTAEIGAEYQWIGPNLFEETSVITAEETGTYVVDVTSPNTGCTSTDSVSLNFMITPSFETDQVLEVCEGTTGTIFTTSISASNIAWFYCETLPCSNGPIEVGAYSDLKDLEVTEGGFYIGETAHPNINNCFFRDTIEVIIVPAPNVDIGEDFQRACEGEDFVLTTGEDPEDGVTYSWYLTDPTNPIAGEETNEITVTEDGNYGIIANDGNCEVSAEVSLDFVDFKFCLNDGIDTLFGCLSSGNGLTIIYTQCDGEAFPNNIAWYKVGEEDPFEVDAVSVNVTTDGVYYMEGYEPVANCFYSDSITVVFEDPPMVDLGIDTTVCGGNIVEITTGIEGFTHEWTIGSEVLVGENDNTIYYETDESLSFIDITVKIFKDDPDCFTFDTKTIFIANTPETLGWLDSLAICSGESVEMFVFDEFQSYSYQWFLNDMLIDNANEDSYVAEMGGDYTVIVTNDICADTLNAFVDEGMVDPLDLGEDLLVCPGEQVVIDATGNYEEYLWFPNSSLDPIITLEAGGPYEGAVDFILQVKNDGCITRDTIGVFFSTPITEAEIFPSQTEICFGDSLLLQAIGGPDFSWDNASTLSSDSIANVIAYPTETTTYSVTVSDECPNNQASTDVTITVFQPVEVGVMPDTTVISGAPFTLRAFGGEEYYWDHIALIQGSNEIAQPTAIVSDSTTFGVQIIDENGCVYTDSVRVNVFINPEDLVEAISIITPNGDGINDELIFDGLEAFSDSQLVIFNRWGNIVYQQDGYQLDGELWDGANGGIVLPADVYYYILKFGEYSIKNTITITRDN